MNRRLPALWIPLLAAVLAGPLVHRASVAWSPEAMHRLADGSGSPFGDVVPSPRLLPALHLRIPLGRQDGPLAAVPPLDGVMPVTVPLVVSRLAELVLAGPSDSARHFPLFPTGPPSQG